MDTVQMYSLYLKYLKLKDSIESLRTFTIRMFTFQSVRIPKSTLHYV